MSFTYTAGAGGATNFQWAVTGALGHPLTCSLDADSNGTADATIADCSHDTAIAFTYGSPGGYTATLSVNDGNLTTTRSTSVIANGTSSTPYTWLAQFGSSGNDVAWGGAVDASGNTFVAGWTDGALVGTNKGPDDIFLAKYDPNRIQLWLKQFGTTSDDRANAVTADADGNAVIVGTTNAPLPPPSAGTGYDLLITKFAPDGAQLWVRQYGTAAGDVATVVGTDADGNILVAGTTDGAFPNQVNAGGADVFVGKYDSNGGSIWVRQFGTSGDEEPSGLAVDADGNVYVTGDTTGALASPIAGSYDAFLAKYDRDGHLQWRIQFGSNGSDGASGVAVDALGNTVVTGFTDGSLGASNAGGTDAFVAKYDTNGTQLWLRQFGTSGSESTGGVALDRAGNAVLTGATSGSLSGPNAGGLYDAFVAKYDTTGNQVWVRQLGTNGSDMAFAVGLDADGNAHVVGATTGAFTGANAGHNDVFVVKYVP